MAFDPRSTSPLYDAASPFWKMMRDALEGEDKIKAEGETYLPMKSGTAAITNPVDMQKAYTSYKVRAEFPEIVAPTVRGCVGTMLTQPAAIELPSSMEYLRERATKDGLTLEALHSKIATELMSVGRFGLLPSINEKGEGYLAAYSTENIRNWDIESLEVGWCLLDESRNELDRATGKWIYVERIRECFNGPSGAFVSRVWVKSNAGWVAEEETTALLAPRGRTERSLDMMPFVFINTNDLSANPDDIPLYGLAKIAIRVYRMDADYSFALHMTSEPTPVAIGFDDPAEAVKKNLAPTSLGSGRLWLLPKGGDAKYLEFSGPGLEAQATAIDASLQRAMVFGAQLFDSKRSAESGEALSLRLGNQHSTLRAVAMNSAAGLERALRNLAVWLGEKPESVVVQPNLDFADHTLVGQEITALVSGWMSGGYSRSTLFWNLQRGGVVNPDRTFEEELADIEAEAATMAQNQNVDPNANSQ